jgi:hypothetical protein
MQTSTTLRRLAGIIVACVLSIGLHSAETLSMEEIAFIAKNMNQEDKAAAQLAADAYKDNGMTPYNEGRMQAGMQAAKKTQVARGVVWAKPAKPNLPPAAASTPIDEAEAAFIEKNMSEREQEAANKAMIAYVNAHGRDDRAAMQQAMLQAAKQLQVARGVDIKGSELTADPNSLPSIALSLDELEFMAKNATPEEKELRRNLTNLQLKAAQDAGKQPDVDLIRQRADLAVKKRQVARGVVMPGASTSCEPAAAAAPATPAPAGDTAARVEAFKAEVVKLDAIGVTYKKALIDAYIAADDQYMTFLSTLDLAPLSDAVPADPKRSDLKRRDQVQTYNQMLVMVQQNLDEWKRRKSNPAQAAEWRKTLETLGDLPTNIRRGSLPPDFLELYAELKVSGQVPAANR